MAETTQAVQAKPKRGMSKSLGDSLVGLQLHCTELHRLLHLYAGAHDLRYRVVLQLGWCPSR